MYLQALSVHYSMLKTSSEKALGAKKGKVTGQVAFWQNHISLYIKDLQLLTIGLSIRRLRKYESQVPHCVFCYDTLNVVTTVGPQIVLKQLERIPDYE